MTTTTATREQRIAQHMRESKLDYDAAAELIDRVDRVAADNAARFKDMHRAAADAELRQAAERQAAADQAAALAAKQRAAADALPIDDPDVDTDDDVAALEERIAAGDDRVTEKQLADARVKAAGRVRFARLRKVADDRKARRAADAERARLAEEFAEHARGVLAEFTPAALVEPYDRAVAALREYAEAIRGRNESLGSLVAYPGAREYGAVPASNTGAASRSAKLVLDGHAYSREDVSAHISRVVGAAGLSHHKGRFDLVDRKQYTVNDRDPELVAEGRSQSAA